MRDAEGQKKESSKVKQTTRQSNTAPSRQSLFQGKNELPQVETQTHDTLHSRQSALPRQHTYMTVRCIHVYTVGTVCLTEAAAAAGCCSAASVGLSAWSEPCCSMNEHLSFESISSVFGTDLHCSKESTTHDEAHVHAHTCIYMYIHVLMRDEKEGRKKQVMSNTCRSRCTQIF